MAIIQAVERGRTAQTGSQVTDIVQKGGYDLRFTRTAAPCQSCTLEGVVQVADRFAGVLGQPRVLQQGAQVFETGQLDGVWSIRHESVTFATNNELLMTRGDF